MSWLEISLFVAAMFTAMAATKLLLEHRAQKLLAHWAEKTGVKLTASTPEMFHRGPFKWRWRSQIVLRFEGTESNGTPVHGYALCGDALLGPLSGDDLEIKFL